MSFDAESYLKSGSNELRMLEYTTGGHSFGINILKVQKIVSRPECVTATMNTQRCIVGVFKDNDAVIPIIDLGLFLGYQKAGSIQGKKIIVTEFLGVLNAFLVDTVEWIHHFYWEDVINANDVMRSINQKYIISIVKPDGERMVPMLDYETIILELCPDLASHELRKFDKTAIDAGGMRILIAEDSPSVRNMLSAEFAEIGFDVTVAYDGKQAYEILKRDKSYELVISDIEMPQMDGLALTCAIRNNPEIKNIPVIVYTSIGDIGMKSRAEFLKADAHVTKLSVEELLSNVTRLIAVDTNGQSRFISNGEKARAYQNHNNNPAEIGQNRSREKVMK
jgi:two-component system chemotaxis response regulator CheV